MTDDEITHKVWLRSARVGDTDTYRPVLEADDDTASDLGDGRALTYAAAVLRAVAQAETDAAIVRQFTGQPISRDDAGRVVLVMRERRPPIDWPTPLTCRPGVSMRTGEAFLDVLIHGKQVGQWDPDEARMHAAHVLELAAAADLDAEYLATLRDIGVPRDVALAVVDDLGRHRGGEPAEPPAPTTPGEQA